MRVDALLCVSCVLASAAGSALGRTDPGAEKLHARIAVLVRQLGDEEFAKREAASKELDSIGEPALGALREAAASDGDAEIRRRAELGIASIARRVTNRELEKLQGTWSLVSYEADGMRIKGEDKAHVFIFKADRWSIEIGGQKFQSGTVQRIELREKHCAIDLLVTDGGGPGAIAVSIYAVDGDSLKYLNCGNPRATEFTTKRGDGRHFLSFSRVKR